MNVLHITSMCRDTLALKFGTCYSGGLRKCFPYHYICSLLALPSVLSGAVITTDVVASYYCNKGSC